MHDNRQAASQAHTEVDHLLELLQAALTPTDNHHEDTGDSTLAKELLQQLQELESSSGKLSEEKQALLNKVGSSVMVQRQSFISPWCHTTACRVLTGICTRGTAINSQW